MTRDFEGRTVLVTGAAGGIGSATVRLLQERGANVIGTDLVGDSYADSHVQVDLSNLAELDKLVAAVGDRPLYGLVNNAAMSTTAPTSEVTATTWDKMFAVNVKAPFFIAERLLPNLERAGGSVVNVSSVHAFATSAGAVPYASTKGAMLALTRALAVDWAGRGLTTRINAVAPAATDTAMLRDGLERTGVSLEELGARHPVGRIAQPEEVAEPIAFLLTPAAAFIHGSVIPVDGGALATLSTEVT